MGVNNQGIMHLASSQGGRPACKNRNAHMSTTLEAFEECGRKCVRCAKHAEAWKRMRAKREALKDSLSLGALTQEEHDAAVRKAEYHAAKGGLSAA